MYDPLRRFDSFVQTRNRYDICKVYEAIGNISPCRGSLREITRRRARDSVQAPYRRENPRLIRRRRGFNLQPLLIRESSSFARSIIYPEYLLGDLSITPMQ